jgi:hypothetical protein
MSLDAIRLSNFTVQWTGSSRCSQAAVDCER